MKEVLRKQYKPKEGDFVPDDFDRNNLPKHLTIKTDGNSKEVFINNPFEYNLDDSKIRKKQTNLTPKKKKRK